ncbi:MAG TPA: hypothetical protein VM324_08545 [Egibacteraceae bacterium]|nr:hypothetical protein [Egibacteraceae bacterium]
MTYTADVLGVPRCSAVTKAGRRCRNTVSSAWYGAESRTDIREAMLTQRRCRVHVDLPLAPVVDLFTRRRLP